MVLFRYLLNFQRNCFSETMEEEKTDFVIPVKTDTDEFVLHGRPCELSSFSFVPPERHAPKERTYFNVGKNERYSSFGYDRIFHQEREFNAKLHRDDREHAKSSGLQVNQEETSKVVPTLCSSVYGKRLSNKIDPPDRAHCRIGIVQSEFYRRNGTEINGHKV